MIFIWQDLGLWVRMLCPCEIILSLAIWYMSSLILLFMYWPLNCRVTLCVAQSIAKSLRDKLRHRPNVNQARHGVDVFNVFLVVINHDDVIMGTMASQITSLTIVYSTVYSHARSKKASRLRVTGLCAGNSPGTGEFPAQIASNAEFFFSISWRHHVMGSSCRVNNQIMYVLPWQTVHLKVIFAVCSPRFFGIWTPK